MLLLSPRRDMPDQVYQANLFAPLYPRIYSFLTLLFSRSEIMKLYQLTVPKDDAQSVMNEFGDIGYAHFIDLNQDESPYNLPYTQ